MALSQNITRVYPKETWCYITAAVGSPALPCIGLHLTATGTNYISLEQLWRFQTCRTKSRHERVSLSLFVLLSLSPSLTQLWSVPLSFIQSRGGSKKTSNTVRCPPPPPSSQPSSQWFHVKRFKKRCTCWLIQGEEEEEGGWCAAILIGGSR